MAIALYSYFRSSAAYRVRIALNLKNLDYEIRPVNLIKDGGEQRKADYLKFNPQGLVPTLIIENTVLTQSSAIIEYLEEIYPQHPLLPDKAEERAHVRGLAQLIACDIHPLNNLRVLNYLKTQDSDDNQRVWYHHWIHEGFEALELVLKVNHCNGHFCFGDSPGMADVFLIPQVYNAKRFELSLAPYPLITGIFEHCMGQRAFIDASPEKQG